jgi:hypothetical protein
LSTFSQHTSSTLAFEAYCRTQLPWEGWGEHLHDSAKVTEAKLFTAENCKRPCLNSFHPALAIAAQAEGLLAGHADLVNVHAALMGADLSATLNAGMNSANNYPPSDR